MSNVQKINISLLKSENAKFNNEKTSFKNVAYSNFSSSYIKSCSDNHVSIMASNLAKLYDKINYGYNKIDSWWNSYNENFENLEKFLSGESGSGAISEASVRNFVASKMNLIADYNKKIDSTFKSSPKVPVDKSIFVFSAGTVSAAGVTDAFASLYTGYSKVSDDSKDNDEEKGGLAEFGAAVASKVKDIGENISDGWSAFASAVSDKTKAVFSAAKTLSKATAEVVSDGYREVADFTNDAKAFTANVFEKIKNLQERTNATKALISISLIEGVGLFGEALVDTLAIVGAAVGSVGTGIHDGCQAIWGAITGNEWESLTKKMWDDTMSFVGKKYVSGVFDKFYENTKLGQWIYGNAFGADTVRAISSGIGYIAGVVALTIATFGAGGVVVSGSAAATTATTVTTTQLAIVAGTAGVGKGAELAWNDNSVTIKLDEENHIDMTFSREELDKLNTGETISKTFETYDENGNIVEIDIQFNKNGDSYSATIYGNEFSTTVDETNAVEGVAYGLATGVWEGFQFWLGGKVIGQFNAFGSKFLNGLTRVGLDAVDSGVEGFTQPLLQWIYKRDNSYGELFNANGGWSNVIINTAIGVGGSALGEGFDIAKYFKEGKQPKVDVDVTDIPKTEVDIPKTEMEDIKVFKNDATDDSAISVANYQTGKGVNYQFRFTDADSIPDLNDKFWTSIKNRDKVLININGRVMSFEDAISYKADYDLNLRDNIKDISKNVESTLSDVNNKFDNAKRFSADNQLEVAEYFNDSKQYLFCKLKTLAQNDSSYIKLYNEINARVGDMDYDRLYNVLNLRGQITDFDNQILKKMDEKIINYTTEELEYIYFYTESVGPVISGTNRNVKVNFKNRVEYDCTTPESRKKWLQLALDSYNKNRGTFKNFDFANIDRINAVMDGIVNKNVLQEDIVVYRGVNDFYFDGNEIPFNYIKPGTIVNDPAHMSTSIVQTNISSKTYKYEVELLAPKGTHVAYLESFTGVHNYAQQELLFGRNTSYKFVSYPEPVFDSAGNIIKYKVKAEIVSVDSLDDVVKNLPKVDDIGEYSDYKTLFNANGKDLKQVYDEMRSKGLISRFNTEIDDMKNLKLYDGPMALAEHDYKHVQNVLLYSMYMGDKLNLPKSDFDILVESAKYHDSGLVGASGHTGHAELSAKKSGELLSGKYSTNDIAKIQAIIEYHEINLENEATFANVCQKYNIEDITEQKKLLQMANILKDADALDRTRFPGGRDGLDTSRLRNQEVAGELVGASYQMREAMSSSYVHDMMDQCLKNNDVVRYNELDYMYNNLECPYRIIEFADRFYKFRNFSSSSEYAQFIIENKKW